MRKATLIIGLACITAIYSSLAHATTWTVCNRSVHDFDVSIAYPSKYGYTSEGEWTLRACGGCVVVFEGDLPATGVFLRGQSRSGAAYEGNTLFCTGRSPFTIERANVDEKTCSRRGGRMKAFKMHNIQKNRHTTNLLNPSGTKRVCID
jgi:uncharacterized membrane protein